MSIAMTALPVDNLWASLTVASLSKSVGALTERFKCDPPRLREVRSVEEKLEEALLSADATEQTSTLLELTKAVALLKAA